MFSPSISATQRADGAAAVHLVVVRDGAVRAQHAEAKPGDFVVAVNDVDVRGASIAEVIEAIARSDEHNALVIDFEACAEQKLSPSGPTLGEKAPSGPPPSEAHAWEAPPSSAARPSVPPGAPFRTSSVSVPNQPAPAGAPVAESPPVGSPPAGPPPAVPPVESAPSAVSDGGANGKQCAAEEPASSFAPPAPSPLPTLAPASMSAPAEILPPELEGPFLPKGCEYCAAITTFTGESLGISITDLESGLIALESVVRDGAASRSRACATAGDILSVINGQDIVGWPLDHVLDVIRARNADAPLLLTCHSPTLTDALGEGRIFDMSIDFDAGEDMGIAICHGSLHHSAHVILQVITRGSAADRGSSVKAHPGDFIVSINGEGVLATSVAMVREMLAVAARPIALELFSPAHRVEWRPTSSPDLKDGTTYDMMVDPAEGEALGFSITDSHDHHIQLSTVTVGGAAHRAAPHAASGDIIVSVNGVKLLSKTLREVQQCILKSSRPMSLTLHKEHDGGAPTRA